jgi:DNA-binding PadR family transcriptional regulator
MRSGKCGSWNLDAGLWEVLSLAGDAFDQAIKTAAAAGWRNGPGERGFGGRGAHGHWGGGHWGSGGAGAWAGFWPGAMGATGTHGGPRGSKAGRGDVRAAILALLKEGPRTGYQIMSDIKERSDGAWRPSPGAVYPALSLLADEGLIEGEESGGRRTYSLTQAGHDYLEQHPEMARAAWESMAQQDKDQGKHDSWEVPGLFAEAAKLGGGIMQVAQMGSPDQVTAAERLLERTRRELYQILADDFTPEEADEDQDDTGKADQ